MPVVTVSGRLGGGAREVGQIAARLLKIDFVDQRLLVEAAQRSGLSVQAIAEHDQRPSTLRERLASTLRTFLERSAAAGADPLTGTVGLEVLLSQSYAEMVAEGREPRATDDLYVKTMTAVIQEVASRGNVVILGRGSQVILADRPDVLHVLCHAPTALRIERLVEREGISAEEASRRVCDTDRALLAFHRKFWKADLDDPALYDLALDTSRLSIELAADLVAQAARAKAAAS